MNTKNNLFEGIINNNRRMLAKAITLIESQKNEDKILANELLKKILNFQKKSASLSFRLGITGTPGVGKSTFIETLGLLLIEEGKKVAVLAIDPSSPLNGGSILGDKTRMELLSRNEHAFIRPSPSLCHLGGVAQKTRESILLCEAAGYDFIIIETVGVGQSEIEVSNMVDFFMVLLLPNAGDELQGIKKGIIELADALIINKCDGHSEAQAIKTLSQYQSALGLLQHHEKHPTQILTTSALSSKKVRTVYNLLLDFQKSIGAESIKAKRLKQNTTWYLHLVNEIISMKVSERPDLTLLNEKLIKSVLENEALPLDAAINFVSAFLA